MATLALWSQLLLLASARMAVASPINDPQQVIHAPETLSNPRKLNGRFLHITGMYNIHSRLIRRMPR